MKSQVAFPLQRGMLRIYVFNIKINPSIDEFISMFLREIMGCWALVKRKAAELSGHNLYLNPAIHWKIFG